MLTTTRRYRVCQRCTHGMSTGDWTSLDYHHSPDEADELQAHIARTLQAIGPVTYSGPTEINGWWICDVCDHDQLHEDPAHSWYAVPAELRLRVYGRYAYSHPRARCVLGFRSCTVRRGR